MIHKLIEWAVGSALIVLLMVVVLIAVGGYSFVNVNVEAYPDPAPAIIEVVAQYPGFSAEEVERQVTIPLEIALAGMPGLTYTRTKSLAGLCHMRNQFDYGVDYYAARQEVINRLALVSGLPNGVSPQISPFTPTGELVRYTLSSPKDKDGRDVYSITDLKSLEDWTLEREFKRLPRIADVTSFGGMVKRYEIHPDPERLKRYGITLSQFQTAVTNSNANVGAGTINIKPNAFNVRAVGLIGEGRDPLQEVLGYRSPFDAVRHIREEEQGRVDEIRDIVLVTVNNVPVRVKDLVTGGPGVSASLAIAGEGVLVGHQPRLGQVSVSWPQRDADGVIVRDTQGRVVWDDRNDVVQGIVLMRKNEATKRALEKVKEKVDELNNNPGRMLPGTKIELHFDLTGLLRVTRETVTENLLLGMGLVTVILLMFLSNVRSAIIVAINIPLALLFAFSVLFLRGKSANLLSIGAVDFGIIVDSSVIMVENIYRHISSGEYAELPLWQRILRACREVEHALLFSTIIMVCAFIPLFTMKGPEGQIFGPMADTYAFALGGALLLALTLSPVLCLLLFKHLKPSRDNFLVRWLRAGYLRQVERFLKHRWLTIAVFLVLLTITGWAAYNRLGGEFMPELEEGNLYIRGTFPVNVSLDESADVARQVRKLFCRYPEVAVVESQVGRPDDGTDPTGYYNVEFSIPLIPEDEWPRVVTKDRLAPEWVRDAAPPRWLPSKRWLPSWLGWMDLEPAWNGVFASTRARTKPELVREMNEELQKRFLGVDWNFSQYIRDNVTECLSGVKGDNSVKIIGPDIDELERLAKEMKAILDGVRGMENVGVFRIKGQPNLDLHVDRKKCRNWGVSVADVQNAIKTAVGGSAVSQMVEGEKTFDITIRWPEHLRGNLREILDIPVEVVNNIVTPGNTPSGSQTPVSGPTTGPDPTGTTLYKPAVGGSMNITQVTNPTGVPRLRLGQLVSPMNDQGQLDPNGSFIRPGVSTIAREQGKRLIAVKFSVRERDLAGAVAEAQQKVNEQGLIQGPYQVEWSGEFQEMEEALKRLRMWIPVSVVLICIMVYMAFHSVLDTLAVLSNVLALSMGGVWALLITGTHFSISAAVGFISIFGVAIMDGLLSISYFNALRAQGLPLREAILEGAGRRVRPMMMTALTAIFGLLPAAVSTRIGAQTQRPLAIVVVGGMVMTLLLNRYLMPVLYSFYGHREPPRSAGGMVH
jgi:cobalt-zinc-cadmium resistance protein CzcA